MCCLRPSYPSEGDVDMWIKLSTTYVTPKPQNRTRMSIDPQDVVYASEFIPYADAVFGAE
jgi:hypothetical protein